MTGRGQELELKTYEFKPICIPIFPHELGDVPMRHPL